MKQQSKKQMLQEFDKLESESEALISKAEVSSEDDAKFFRNIEKMIGILETVNKIEN